MQAFSDHKELATGQGQTTKSHGIELKAPTRPNIPGRILHDIPKEPRAYSSPTSATPTLNRHNSYRSIPG